MSSKVSFMHIHNYLWVALRCRQSASDMSLYVVDVVRNFRFVFILHLLNIGNIQITFLPRLGYAN